MDQAVVERLLPTIQDAVGPHLLAAYEIASSGEGYALSGRFEPALMLFFSEGFPLHEARDAVRRSRINWRQVLDAPPMVFTPHSLARYVRLFPLFSHHLSRHSRLLHGQIMPLESGARVHPVERLAFLISEAIAASAALAPEKSTREDLRRLQRLASQLGLTENNVSAPPAELFTHVQVYLRLIVDSIPAMSQHRTPLVKSSGEPNLLALYEDEQRLLVIIPSLSANLLQKIDWPAISHPAAAHLTALSVATTDQLYLTLQAQRPLDFLLGTFRRLWGADLLKGLTVSARAVFRQAARKPATLLSEGALGAYLLSPDAKTLHGLIHDYQNRLLNLQLAHELLCRMLALPVSSPPQPLPRRDEPLTTRIDAIVEHFDWWADYYLQQHDARSADEKLSPP